MALPVPIQINLIRCQVAGVRVRCHLSGVRCQVKNLLSLLAQVAAAGPEVLVAQVEPLDVLLQHPLLLRRLQAAGGGGAGWEGWRRCRVGWVEEV